MDPLRIRQAIENLLINAVAHTPRGGQVRAGARREAGAIRLTVEDTGPGFDPGFVHHALQPFATGAAPGAGNGQAVGLGLAIVEAIAQAHGGHATVGNRAEGGARVTLVLPAAG